MQSTLTDWFTSPQGQRLLEAESLVFNQLISGINAACVLQIGGYPSDSFVSNNSLVHCATCRVMPEGYIEMSPSTSQSIPLQASTVDMIMLPHTLDTLAQYNILLAQAYALLRPGGDMLISQFNPLSWLSVAAQFGFRPENFPACYFHAVGPMARLLREKGMVNINKRYTPFMQSKQEKSNVYSPGIISRIRAYCMGWLGTSVVTHWRKSGNHPQLVGHYEQTIPLASTKVVASAHQIKSS